MIYLRSYSRLYKKNREMHRIKGRIQHYAWGGKTFISGLLKQEKNEGLPNAEYWLGSHPGGTSTVVLSENAFTTLTALINSDKTRYLGEYVTSQFNGLPFLLKILDVKDMLSIQVHPTKAAAKEGFKRENELAIPLTAPHRNYKDENHKPEIMVALSDFWLLHGFADDIPNRVKNYEILLPFASDFNIGGIKGLYQKLMELPYAEVDEILQPLSERIIPLYEMGQLSKSSPDFWAARAMQTFKNGEGHFDKGIFSIYLFNILNMRPGQGIFQGAGMPHAYLEGQNIELMSNSDNVLRAGLTPKHIDIPALLANTNFVSTIPKIIDGNLDNPSQTYDCPIPDFILHAHYLKAKQKMTLNVINPSIILTIGGNAMWTGNTTFNTSGIDSFFVTPGESIQIESSSDTQFFLAAVPH
jgi:mannose-6-phosphate isomerase